MTTRALAAERKGKHPATGADLRTGQRIHCRFTNHELQAENIAIAGPRGTAT